MNKKRLEQIKKLASQIGDLRVELQSILEEEQEYLGQLPESLQNSAPGELSEEAIVTLANAIESLESVEFALGGLRYA